MSFDEARVGGHGFEVVKNGVEAFDVPHLEHGIVLLCKLDQLGCLSGIIGHGFFKQNVFAMLQQSFGEFEMGGGRRDNADRITSLDGFSQ